MRELSKILEFRYIIINRAVFPAVGIPIYHHFFYYFDYLRHMFRGFRENFGRQQIKFFHILEKYL